MKMSVLMDIFEIYYAVALTFTLTLHIFGYSTQHDKHNE